MHRPVRSTAPSCAWAHEVTLPKVIAGGSEYGRGDSTSRPAQPVTGAGHRGVRPIEMAAAYATVADGGIYHSPRFVSRVVDRTGRSSTTGKARATGCSRNRWRPKPWSPWGHGRVRHGDGGGAAEPDVAGKTGTTENSSDAWFNGITPTLVASVWIGDPKGEVPMYVNGVEVFGADYPTRIWHDVMRTPSRASPIFRSRRPTRPPAAGKVHLFPRPRAR